MAIREEKEQVPTALSYSNWQGVIGPMIGKETHDRIERLDAYQFMFEYLSCKEFSAAEKWGKEWSFQYQFWDCIMSI